MKCDENCRCGTRNKPCKNKVNMEKSISFKAMWLQTFNFYCLISFQEGAIAAVQTTDTQCQIAHGKKRQAKQGFRLCHELQQSEDMEREKEHEDVKVVV